MANSSLRELLALVSASSDASLCFECKLDKVFTSLSPTCEMASTRSEAASVCFLCFLFQWLLILSASLRDAWGKEPDGPEMADRGSEYNGNILQETLPSPYQKYKFKLKVTSAYSSTATA